MPFRRAFFPLFCMLFGSISLSFADPVPVQYTQGMMRGFLVVRSETGSVLGYGDFVQIARGERVTARLTLRFRDGSLDDETTVYTQRNVFALISDHHVQRGPFFSKACDVLVEANGNVTTRTTDNDGRQKVEVNHVDLPADAANGIVPTILLNIRADAPGFKVGMVAPTGKGRLIHLDISPDGQGAFSCVAGGRRKANIFRIKPELGGIAGAVAPLVGRQPGDVYVWVLEGVVPAIVREVGQLSEGGPVVSLELAGTAFAPLSPARR